MARTATLFARETGHRGLCCCSLRHFRSWSTYYAQQDDSIAIFSDEKSFYGATFSPNGFCRCHGSSVRPEELCSKLAMNEKKCLRLLASVIQIAMASITAALWQLGSSSSAARASKQISQVKSSQQQKKECEWSWINETSEYHLSRTLSIRFQVEIVDRKTIKSWWYFLPSCSAAVAAAKAVRSPGFGRPL